VIKELRSFLQREFDKLKGCCLETHMIVQVHQEQDCEFETLLLRALFGLLQQLPHFERILLQRSLYVNCTFFSTRITVLNVRAIIINKVGHCFSQPLTVSHIFCGNLPTIQKSPLRKQVHRLHHIRQQNQIYLPLNCLRQLIHKLLFG